MRKLIALLWTFFVFVVPGFAQDNAGQNNTEALAADESPAPDEPPQNRWPREIKVSNAEITVYQPQLETFDENNLTSRAAVSVKRNDSDKTDYCAIWMKAVIDTDKEARIVKLRDLKITQIAYPDASEKVKESLGNIIRANILKADMSISLDHLLAMMDTVKKQQSVDSDFDVKVPEFFFSKEAAVLVTIDGDPVMRDLGDGISQVANTSYLIAQDSSDKKFYLHCAGHWFTATEVPGPWSAVAEVPDKIAALDKKDDPGDNPDDDEVIPKIIVSTKPAELIQSYGEPECAQIPGTKLSYLVNSDNDIFRDESDNRLYLLASGRWFTAEKKEGPWSFIAPDKLPKDFSEIPAGSPKANVLASVPGTPEAKEAVMESYVPQTATIKRGSVTLDIEYDGEPEFQPITGTDMSYAVNTQTPVVKLNNKYYACENGAWYESSSPKGGWEVCIKVPNEIYSIPPSCPIYNTTFVKVYNYNDDNVDVGYTSGYDDSYVNGGVIVYGTGYWYRPWWRHHWWPRPWTYGWRYRYDHHHGCWNRYDRYRDRQGRYVAWNNRYDSKYRQMPALAAGNYWGKQPVARYNNAYKYNKQTIKTGYRHDTDRRPAVATHNQVNNLYAGKDGKIYRHGLDGWQQQHNGQWQSEKREENRGPYNHPAQVISPNQKPSIAPNPNRPITTPVWDSNRIWNYNDLNSHYNSRQRGDYRTSPQYHYSGYRSEPSYRGGSYGGMSRGYSGGGGRSGGGGSHGGGGRR